MMIRDTRFGQRLGLPGGAGGMGVAGQDGGGAGTGGGDTDPSQAGGLPSPVTGGAPAGDLSAISDVLGLPGGLSNINDIGLGLPMGDDGTDAGDLPPDPLPPAPDTPLGVAGTFERPGGFAATPTRQGFLNLAGLQRRGRVSREQLGEGSGLVPTMFQAAGVGGGGGTGESDQGLSDGDSRLIALLRRVASQQGSR